MNTKDAAHAQAVKSLEATIKDLETRLNQSKDSNKQEETKLSATYEYGDNGYRNTLEAYDNDMRQQNEEKARAQAEYDDQASQLA